jgi:urease accessory protein
MTTDAAALYRLLAWTSPGYPTGAFSYSHGLEWAVETGAVTNLATLLDYVEAVLARGGGWVDPVLFVHAWRATASPNATARSHSSPHAAHQSASAPCATQADPHYLPRAEARSDPARSGEHTDLSALVELAAAFRGSSETALESRQQGAAFLDVTRKAWPHPALDNLAEHATRTNTPVAHCIAVAVTCAAHDIALEPALHAYLHAVAANLVSAGARLIPLGQTQAQIAIARLSPTIVTLVERAQSTSLDDLGTAAPAVELCSLKHETQYTRLFRS